MYNVHHIRTYRWFTLPVRVTQINCSSSNTPIAYSDLHCLSPIVYKQEIYRTIHVAWRNYINYIWKLNSKTHNDLLHHINNCLPIDILLEKRCKFIYNIINSEHSLHSIIALYSLYNGDTTLGENIRYPNIFHV